MTISAREMEFLCDSARRASIAVMQVYAGAIAVTYKEGTSPLTEADLRAHAIIRSDLEHGFPGVDIVSEEDDPRKLVAMDNACFLVDPVDGTKEFVRRNGEFTVNIALLVDGRIVGGVVAAPALQQVYWGSHEGAFRAVGEETMPIQVAQWTGDRVLRVIGSRSHGSERLTKWMQELPVAHEFVSAGSSLKFCRVAEGIADVYPRFGRTHQWDTAAGQAVLEAAGGCVEDFWGRPLRYGGLRDAQNSWFVARSCSLPDLLLPRESGPPPEPTDIP